MWDLYFFDIFLFKVIENKIISVKEKIISILYVKTSEKTVLYRKCGYKVTV